MRPRPITDLASTVSCMIMGAGDTIELVMSSIDSEDFGLHVEDLVNIVDNRLTLRCLLTFPGACRHKVGEIYDNILTNKSKIIKKSDLELFKNCLTILEQAGWQTRLVPYYDSAKFLSVDNNEVIYYPICNNNLPVPHLSSNPQDITHYHDIFESCWERSYIASATEALYAQETAFMCPPVDAQIALVSHAAWTQLIGRLSANPHLLHGLPPRKFEELIAELLSRDGLEVQLTPQTRDGGRDVLAFHETPVGKLLYLVECKRHQPGCPVGIAIVQRLYGVVAQERATAGLIVTTSRFSKAALTFANTVGHQVKLRDYDDLKKWIEKHWRSH